MAIICRDSENKVYSYLDLFVLPQESIFLQGTPPVYAVKKETRKGCEVYLRICTPKREALLNIVGKNETDVRGLVSEVKKDFGLGEMLELNRDLECRTIELTALYKLGPRICARLN
jgi:hypothetical protein